ncbi:glycosyltransferase [Congregibacter litoralis]|uniref:Glycosyltransferase n=1 Tax=Congregibacter litoralis KT71 TaxID=314285 RepID=A4AB91_9GAMM|nr:glycosyltransferase [Congregibacter litoralis]EAQ96645.1 Glycosyltransferase [Congregibacter litoralis KT71]
MKKLLFITPELPYPPQSGGKVKSLKLLEALGERYEVTLVSPLKLDDADYRHEFEARSPCVEHIHRRIDVPRSAKGLLGSYLAGKPLNVHRSYDAAIAQQVRRLAPSHDIIFLDHYEVSAYLPDNYKGLVVYHAHNAYHQIWDRYARLPGNIALRAAAFIEAGRVRRAEHRIAKRADLIFAAPNDAELLLDSGIDGEKIAHTYHLGDDGQLTLPALNFSASKKKLMYVGLLGWEANVVGLLWFIENVWPRLLQEHPDLTFDIVGKNPDQRLITLAAIYPGIQLRGFVADLQEVYRDARVSVAPLLFGSGMKVKVLDAMARGMPTVTTPVGAEGVDYINNRHLCVAHNAEDMALATLQLLKDEALWTRMRDESRQLIRERYTWRQLFSSMHNALDSALLLKQAGTADSAEEHQPVLQHV